MSDLAIQRQGDVITPDKIQLVKDMYCKGATDSELQLFVAICNKTGLDPMLKQCWAVKRWDSGLGREVMAFQTGIDGFRVIANRSDKYSGQLGPFWCGDDGSWVDVWLSDKPPVAAKIGVLRADFKEPLWAVAKFSSYAARKKDGSLTPFWAKMPDLMISKVAECLALRKAFPQDLSGVYSDSEMEQAQIVDVHPPIENQARPKLELDVNQSCAIPSDKFQVKQPEPVPQKTEPERFPKPEQIRITREQADQMKSYGLTQGWTLEDITHLIYTKYKVIRWGELNQLQFAELEKYLQENPK